MLDAEHTVHTSWCWCAEEENSADGRAAKLLLLLLLEVHQTLRQRASKSMSEPFAL